MNAIAIKNKKNGLKAIINLSEGARLQSLILDNTSIIKEDKISNYKDSFASSILFPFANRIKMGIMNLKTNIIN